MTKTKMEALQEAAKNAVSIYRHGACNPRGISRALVQACDAAAEIVGSDMERGEYGPARLILSQLGYLAKSGIGCYLTNRGFTPERDLVYCDAVVDTDTAPFDELPEEDHDDSAFNELDLAECYPGQLDPFGELPAVDTHEVVT